MFYVMVRKYEAMNSTGKIMSKDLNADTEE